MRRVLSGVILAIGCTALVNASAAQAQTPAPAAYYYPAAGIYATTLGTVRIPAPGYYYNVPMSAVPAQGYRSYSYAPTRQVSSSTRQQNDLTWLFMK